MYTWLRVLIVNNSEDEAQRIVQELRRGGFELTWARVATAAAMSSALERREWDVVIVDATLPGFPAADVLAFLRAHDADLPCLFLSDAIGDIPKRALQRLVPAVERQLRDVERRRAQGQVGARAEHLTSHDPVTNLPNRALLQDRLRHALATAHRTGEPLAFVILNLDGFKDINDTLGHSTGDLVLQQVGRRIQQALREVDTSARLGNDEFAAVLPGNDAVRALRVVQRMRARVEAPLEIDGASCDVRVRAGIALYPVHGQTATALLQRADTAMRAAKEMESRVAVYAPDLDQHMQQRLTVSRELREAIRRHQLVWRYQPKVDLHNRRLLGFEALTYWSHPTRKLLPPGRFIGIAEQTGVIRDLTLAAIDAALRTCRQWMAEVGPAIVAVNLSPKTLTDEGFPDDVARLLDAAGLAPSCLELEITESVMMTEPLRARATLARLSDLGIRLSIDDFGTGYASLSYLQTLPVRELKIDRSFVTDLTRHGDDLIVRSIIDLAHKLGLTVIAEGVETRAAWDRLAALECNAAQGFFVSPPMAREAMTAWLDRWQASDDPPA